MKNEINMSLLKRIVGIQSLSSESNQCFKALKLIEVEIKNKNIPIIIDFNEGIPFLIAGNLDIASILFLNHIDIVPAKTNQFKLVQKENILFGRGVLDMKGPLTAALGAFLKLWKSGNRNVVFAVSSDEEIGGFKGAAFLAKNVFKNIKLVIIPDGGGENLVLIQKAPFHIKICAKGKSAHGSRPWEGKNAAENLLKCCFQIIKNINSVSHDQTTAIISQFHSGEATNMVPDKAEAIIDIRIKKEPEIKKLINKIEVVTQNCHCDWEKIDEPLFFEIKENNIFVKKWAKAFREIHSKEVKLIIESGASDARFLWKELKIPIIVTSAIGGGAHSNKEWADLDSLNKLSETIVEFINSL